MNLDIKYYLSVLLRRSPYLIIVLALFTSLGITLATILPSEYQAQALLLVESPQIPTQLAASTVNVVPVEQLQVIQKRMMTRENLLDTANSLGVYDQVKAQGKVMTASDIVEDMRSHTSINYTSGKLSATLLTISFRANTAQMAAAVTNDLLTKVLQDNVEMRTGQAGETLDFFETERDRLGSALDAQSTLILQFQNEKAGALPQDLANLQQRQATIISTKATLQAEIANLKSQRAQVVEIFERTGGVQAPSGKLTPEEAALAAAKTQYEDAKLIYSATNPKLQILAAKVTQAEQRLQDSLGAATTTAQSDNSAPVSDAERLYQAQLAQIDSEIQFRTDNIAKIDAELQTISDKLREIPANSLTLTKLQRDFTNVQNQYDAAVRSLSQAATGERIELMSKGQRISVIEQATPPESPSSPNRVLISAGGAGLGIILGLGLIVLLELLDKSIRRPSQITSSLGITPIAILPYIRTDREVLMKRLILFGIVAFFVLVVPLALFTVNSMFYPLDKLIEPLANKFGLSLSF